MKRISLIVWILVPLQFLAAQTEMPTIRVGTEEILLDVIARDKKGQPVTDLKTQDLQIYDNGILRKITSFRLIQGSQQISSEEKGRTSAAAADATPAKRQLNPLEQVRLMTLIFNRLDLDARRLSRTAALDLLGTELPQNVYISVWVLGENLEAIQPFTNDRELLRAAIEHATSGAYSEYISDSARIQQQLQQLLGPNTSGDSPGEQLSNFSSGGGGSGAAGAPDSGLAANQAMAQMMYNALLLTRSSELAQTGRAAVWGLISAVEQQYRLPGRKSVLLFSSGFGIPQGMEEAFRTLISTANRFNVTFYAIDARGLNTKSPNQQALSDLRDAASAAKGNARKGNGLVTPAMAKSTDMAIDAGKANTQDTLATLAESTGGFLIANTNDFRAPLRKVREDIDTYYELTYSPAIEKYDGSFRKVVLKTDRSNVRLQSRSGYFALPAGTAGGGPVLLPYEMPLLQALETRPTPRSFGFQSAGLHYRGANKQPVCEIVLDVPIGNLNLREDKESNRFQGDLAYLALVKDAKGVVVRKIRDDRPLAATSDQVALFRESHFIYNERLDLPPGRYTLETALLDRQTGQTSVRRSVFIIPAIESKLGISSIAIVRSVNDSGSAGTPENPLNMSGKVITPTLSPVVKKASSSGVSFYVVIYPNPDEKQKQSLTMEFQHDGEKLGSGSPSLGEPDSQGRVQYVATAPVDKLAPGNYQVRFVVKQGQESAEESVAFSVE